VARLLEALAHRTGMRFVYATGWSDASALARLSSTVFVTREVPHRWLFPRVRAAVHHGGAGTTAAAIIAGTPSLIAWMIVDQVFWAERVDRLGAGIDLGRFDRLDADAICRALRRVADDTALGERLKALRAAVNQEDGVAAGVSAIRRYAGEPHARAHGLSSAVGR
jgi:UDP:flavonoid glycosyltransferase YjiC (YdhE family)